MKLTGMEETWLELFAVTIFAELVTPSLRHARRTEVSKSSLLQSVLTDVHGQHTWRFITTKESVYIRKEFNSYWIGLGQQYGRRFIVLEHQ